MVLPRACIGCPPPSKKNGAYATIRELEFDLSMGKLTEEDFQILKRQYTQEAVGYMKEMDKLESSQATFSKPVDTDLEDEIEDDDWDEFGFEEGDWEDEDF